MHLRVQEEKKRKGGGGGVGVQEGKKEKSEAGKTPPFSEEAETLGSSAHSPALIFPLKLQ